MSRFRLGKKEPTSIESRKSMRWMIVGAIISAIGIAGIIIIYSFTQMNIGENEALRDQVIAPPGLSPFHITYIFVGMAMIGLAVIGYGVYLRI